MFSRKRKFPRLTDSELITLMQAMGAGDLPTVAPLATGMTPEQLMPLTDKKLSRLVSDAMMFHAADAMARGENDPKFAERVRLVAIKA